jgi:hypothetical protein
MTTKTLEQIAAEHGFTPCGHGKLCSDKQNRDYNRAMVVMRDVAEQCRQIAASMRGDKCGIGPLFGAGWNEAAKQIEQHIAALLEGEKQ